MSSTEVESWSLLFPLGLTLTHKKHYFPKYGVLLFIWVYPLFDLPAEKSRKLILNSGPKLKNSIPNFHFYIN